MKHLLGSHGGYQSNDFNKHRKLKKSTHSDIYVSNTIAAELPILDSKTLSRFKP